MLLGQCQWCSHKVCFFCFLSIKLLKSPFWHNSREQKLVKIIATVPSFEEQLVKAKWRLELK